MARRTEYTDGDWAAHAKGVEQAGSGRILRVPPHLTAAEQFAFRDGYHSTREDKVNLPVAQELRSMLGGAQFGKLMQRLVRA
jgi:hypothetical protein